MSQKYRIVLTGGGTGGHIFPLIAVAEKLKEKLETDVSFLYVGSKGKMETEAMAQANIPARFIVTGKFRRYFSLLNFLDLFRVPFGFLQSLWILLWFMPDAILSKGGYVAVPVVLAARAYRIPVLTQESDAMPGVANRIIGKFSQRVALAYPAAAQYFLAGQSAVTGNPVREELLHGDGARARTRFSLDESKPVILVLGGSQGSKIINQALSNALPALLTKFQVIHQTGANNFEETSAWNEAKGVRSGESGYVALPFLNGEELADALAVATLVVCRAGANHVSEIAAVGRPAILIPLATAANDHQRMNAYEVARGGGALVLEEGNLGPNILQGKIEHLIDDQELYQKMSQAIRIFYHPKAAETIAHGMIDLIRQ